MNEYLPADQQRIDDIPLNEEDSQPGELIPDDSDEEYDDEGSKVPAQ